MTVDIHSIHHVTLLRHAQSVANENKILQGQQNSTLSESGLKQAVALSQHWKTEGVTFDLAISSPLDRARMTAEVLSETLGFSIEKNEMWMERNFGVAEGKTYDELQTLRRDLLKRSPYVPSYETGESDWDLFMRASSAIQDILRREAGRYLIVSHGGILNAAMHSILGVPPSSPGHRSIIRLENTGYAVTEYNHTTDNWDIFQVNDTRHLGYLPSHKGS
jgi:broad specificity phosphatase PhoE